MVYFCNAKIELLMRNCFLLLVIAVMFASCAKVVMPVGGPQDVTPPTVLKNVPDNSSVNFAEKNIKITFDEFVVLNNPSENIIISPPLANAPQYTMKGKTLIINFTDSLVANTTYNIVFANAIKDYTEGNLLPFYQYSFSTGDFIDSATLSGKLLDAQSLQPVPNVSICLYEEDIDSLPYTVLPKYLTKSSKEGTFAFSNIKDGKYKVFAVGDINSNFIFDLPNEGIAYADTLFSSISGEQLQDSSMQQLLTLYYFTEEDTVQRLSAITPTTKGIYRFAYKMPVRDWQVLPLGEGKPFFTQISDTRDTVSLYFKEDLTDSLYLLFSADDRRDTMLVEPYKAPARQGRGKKTEVAELKVRALNSGDLFHPLTLAFSYPVQPIDSFAVTFVKKNKSKNDTLVMHYSVPDSLVMQLPLPFTFEEKFSYMVWIEDSLFRGYNGLSHDTLKFEFTTKSIRDYGNLQIHYTLNEDADYLVYLLDSRDKVVRMDKISQSTEMEYSNLVPGGYKIKAIKDLNRNGKWDTGSYKKKRQPEPIYFFEKPIQIRGFWDLEEEFRIGN